MAKKEKYKYFDKFNDVEEARRFLLSTSRAPVTMLLKMTQEEYDSLPEVLQKTIDNRIRGYLKSNKFGDYKLLDKTTKIKAKDVRDLKYNELKAKTKEISSEAKSQNVFVNMYKNLDKDAYDTLGIAAPKKKIDINSLSKPKRDFFWKQYHNVKDLGNAHELMYGSDEVMERLYDIMIKDKKSQVDIIYNQLNGQLSEANIEKNLPDLENKTEEDVEKMQPSISYKNYLDEIYRTLI